MSTLLFFGAFLSGIIVITFKPSLLKKFDLNLLKNRIVRKKKPEVKVVI